MRRAYRKLKINGRTVPAHRHIMEQHLGRQLTAGEVVHHINNDPQDNRIENLEVLTHAEHSAHHNQRHPLTKTCEMCQAQFTPHPTKRARAKTCSWECRNALIKRNHWRTRGNDEAAA